VRHGIQSAGKISYFVTYTLYVLLTILLLRVIFLPGAMGGILYLFKPDFSKLFTVKIWSEAATQCFFQFNIGMGICTTFSSFRKVDSKLVQSSRYIPIGTQFFSHQKLFYSQRADRPIDRSGCIRIPRVLQRLERYNFRRSANRGC
jgi:SNF family Na+-dependent transporter